MRKAVDRLVDLLLEDSFREKLNRGETGEVIDRILKILREEAKAHYIAITVWDASEDVLYLHRYLGDDGREIPPSAVGNGPMGVCMEKQELVVGDFSDFARGDKRLAEVVGPVLCFPISFQEGRWIGSVGLGRRKGYPPFSKEELELLKAAGSVASVVISANISQDLLSKRDVLVETLVDMLGIMVENIDLDEKALRTLRYLRSLFEADYAVMGEVSRKRGIVRLSYALGLPSGLEIRLGEGVMGMAALQEKPLFFKKYPEALSIKSCPVNPDVLGSCMAVPISAYGSADFVLMLMRRKGRRSFTGDDFYNLVLMQQMFSLLLRLAFYESEKDRLLRMKARAERLEALGALASGIAHDFNNVIGVIMGYAQIAAESTEEEDTKKMLSLIIEQCRHAARLASQILHVSREQKTEEQLVDLKLLVKSLFEILERTLPENIAIVYEDDGKDHYYVIGDPTKIHSMILNIATNAKDAMSDGGTFSIRLSKREVPFLREEFGYKRAIILEFEDTGCGIPEEHIGRIFDPFFTTKEPGKGTGLGLSQVYSTVKQMGGHIDVVSCVGEGTKFVIYLPEAQIDRLKEQEKEKKAEEKEAKCKAIVVEDNEELLNLLKLVFFRMGVDALPFTDPEEAFEAFLRHKGEIDLLVSDVVMPKMSGLELAQKVVEEKPEVKVVLITGYTSVLGKVKAFLEKHKGILLEKPFTIDRLQEVLRTFCSSGN